MGSVRKLAGTTGFVAGTVFGLSLVATCFPPNPDADLGSQDASVRVDIKSADAAPGSMVMKLDCDKIATGTDAGATSTSTNTYWYADVMVPGLDPAQAPHVSVMLCESECWGNGCGAPPCGASTSCRPSG